MNPKYYPWLIFAAGFAAGIVVSFAGIFFLVQAGLRGEITGGNPISNSFESLRKTIVKIDEEKVITSVYGKVTKVEGGSLTLHVFLPSGEKDLQFVYDQDTAFTQLAHDEASTPIEAIPANMLNKNASVLTKEAVGSVENQHALSVTAY